MDRIATGIAVAGTAMAFATAGGLILLAGSMKDPDPAAAQAQALKAHRARLAEQRQYNERHARFLREHFSQEAIAERDAAAAEQQGAINLGACRLAVIASLKDPSSYREHSALA